MARSWREEASRQARLIHQRIDKWCNDPKNGQAGKRVALPKIDRNMTALSRGVALDPEYSVWVKANIIDQWPLLNQSSGDVHESMLWFCARLSELMGCLNQDRPGSALSRWDEATIRARAFRAAWGISPLDEFRPWAGMEWPRRLPGQTEKEHLLAMGKALEQVSRWFEKEVHGYSGMLKVLADHLDHGCGLPAHGVAIRNIAGELDARRDGDGKAHLIALREAAVRISSMAQGISYYLEQSKVHPRSTWEAPLQWPTEAREAAQRINNEIHRAVQFCATWTLNGVPADHPCHELDCGHELWAMDWYRIPGHHSDKMNAKVHIDDGDRRRVEILVDASASATWRALEQVLGQVSAHSQEVDGHKWTRSHLDCADDDMPDFHGYAKRLEDYAISWRMRIDSLAITQNLAARRTSAAEAEKNASGIVAVLPSGDIIRRISDGRGEPLALPDLLRRANLHGPNAIRKPLARLLATLRSTPHTYRSVFILSGNRKGKAHADTKMRLIGLKEQGLSEKEPDGTGWRLGERAFADKGEKKGETISR